MNGQLEVDPKLIPLTLDWGQQLGETFIDGLKKALKKRDAAISALERRIMQLELRGEVKYVGIWREGTEYLPGNFTTTNGCLWHCEQPTRSRPGTDATWKMAVKRGTCE